MIFVSKFSPRLVLLLVGITALSIAAIACAGEDGATGAQGPQGPQGAQGIEGPQGQTGATGSQGRRGNAGIPGTDGVDGSTGERGERGPAGPQGIAGEPAFVTSGFNLARVGTYATSQFDESAAEIVKFDPKSGNLFVVNAQRPGIDVLSITKTGQMSAPATTVDIALVSSRDVSAYGATVNSVDVHNGVVVAAVEADTVDGNGTVVFYDSTTLDVLNSITVGVLPDMVTFTPDGTKVITANEGQPNDDYTVDPEGTVSVIDVSGGVATASHTLLTFAAFDGQLTSLRSQGVRVFGPNASVSQDMEPEYVAVSADSKTAYVALQENNALAIVDLVGMDITSIIALGTKDHNKVGNGLDASNRDGRINIRNWPVHGLYMPDAIATYAVDGVQYIVSANEGDSRDYDGYSEEERVADLTLDPTAFPNAAELQEDANLGRLKTTTTLGDDDNDGDYDRIFSYGARSFSIWNSSGELVWDSGDQLERILAKHIPKDFNSTNDENGSFDDRSDDKGPEPEAVKIVQTGTGEWIVFIGLERVGGIASYNITNPKSPEFIGYMPGRFFEGDAAAGTAGDLGPESIEFISASDSPTGRPLIVVANEVSCTTTAWEMNFTP